jgi:four helix bundle protein
MSGPTEQSALAATTTFSKDERLRRQIEDAAGSVSANIAEGFGQGTDRAFANHLLIARGSANEVRAHLHVTAARSYLLEETRAALDRELEEITRIGLSTLD